MLRVQRKTEATRAGIVPKYENYRREVKARSKAVQTMTVQLANGYCRYLGKITGTYTGPWSLAVFVPDPAPCEGQGM